MATQVHNEPILLRNCTDPQNKHWNDGIRKNNHPEQEMYYLQRNFRMCGFKIKTGDSLDEDEMEVALANVVGAYMYYSAYHKKIHRTSDENSIMGDCFECMRDFISAVDEEFYDLSSNMEKLLELNGWKEMSELAADDAQREEETHREFVHEREQKHLVGLRKQSFSGPQVSSPEATPITQTLPPQSLHSLKKDYRRSSSPHNNPPSIILTEVKESDLLSGDRQLFNKKWDEWCASAFDQHKLPPKFKSQNISCMKRLGRRSICLSFFERPKRYLIDYFLHRMKDNRACVFGKYQENYSPQDRTTYTSSTESQPRPRQIHNHQRFSSPRRRTPQSYSNSPQPTTSREHSYYNLPYVPQYHDHQLFFDPPQRYPSLSFDRRGTKYHEQHRLFRVEEQLQHISHILSQLIRQPLW